MVVYSKKYSSMSRRKIMVEQWLKDFNEKGFVLFRDEALADMIDVDSFTLKYNEEMLRDNSKGDLPEHVAHQMDIVSQYLKHEYLSRMFDKADFVKYILWEGVDADTAAWHNDGFEGMNAFFLLYFDDQDEETGGVVEFKWKDGEESFYPKRGDLILLNQQSGFFHRAEKATIKRRQCSFDYKVNEY